MGKYGKTMELSSLSKCFPVNPELVGPAITFSRLFYTGWPAIGHFWKSVDPPGVLTICEIRRKHRWETERQHLRNAYSLDIWSQSMLQIAAVTQPCKPGYYKQFYCLCCKRGVLQDSYLLLYVYGDSDSLSFCGQCIDRSWNSQPSVSAESQTTITNASHSQMSHLSILLGFFWI